MTIGYFVCFRIVYKSLDNVELTLKNHGGPRWYWTNIAGILVGRLVVQYALWRYIRFECIQSLDDHLLSPIQIESNTPRFFKMNGIHWVLLYIRRRLMKTLWTLWEQLLERNQTDFFSENHILYKKLETVRKSHGPTQ